MTQEHQFCLNIIARFCAAKPTESASVWAEKTLILNEPKIKGPFTLNGREFLREMIDAGGPLTSSLKGGTDFVTVAGTGIGKTVSLIARMLYRIDQDPTRALVVKPTGGGGPAGAKSFSKTRFQKAIRATPCLRDKIPTGAARYDFSTSQIQLNGSIIDFTGSNSAGQLAENRCDHVEQDEIDKYPPQTETSKEANPVILADERTKSVPGAKRFKQSTPTLGNTGIWEEFKKTDQRRYFVPCPHCSRHVVFAWSKRFSVFEPKGFEAYIKWADSARNSDGTWDIEQVVRTAHAVCPWCQGAILSHHKYEMIKRGEWRPTAKGIPGHIGWHLPSMYSTSRDCDFGAMAKKFLTAKRSIDGVKGFINSDLAEPDVNQSAKVDKIGAASANIEITGEWLKILSCDHQEKPPYFWWVVRAWNGADAAHGLAYGSAMQWHEIDEIQAKHKIIPQAVVIDARFQTNEVLQNCANLQMETRCQLNEPVQDQLPMVNGWTPCMSFGNKRMFRDEDTGLYQPYRLKKGNDPYSGTEFAKRMQIEVLEFKADLFEDSLENIRNGKTFFKWTISTDLDVDEYHKHMAGKIRKSKKNNPRDYSWVQRRTDWPDHIRSCELMGLVHAYYLNLISFDAINAKEDDNKEAK